MLLCCYYSSNIICKNLRWRSTLNHLKWRWNEKLMSFESRRVQIEEKRKTNFVSMKVFFFNSHWFFFFSSSKTNTWAMRAKLMNLFNHQCKVLIMFVLISYFQLSFNYIIFPIFWLDSTRFQLGFNYVCWLCIR